MRLGSQKANNQPFGRGQNRLSETGFSLCLQEHCGQRHVNALPWMSILAWAGVGKEVVQHISEACRRSLLRIEFQVDKGVLRSLSNIGS